jgi:hypothetical protein
VDHEFGPAGDDWWSLTIIYKSGDGESARVFTPERIRDMCRLETLILKQPQTWATADSSALLFYNASGDFLECPLLPEAAVQERVAELLASVSANGSDSPYARFVQPAFASSGRSAYTRTAMQIYGGEGTKSKDHLKKITEEVVLAELGLEYSFLRSALQVDDDRFHAYGSVRVRLGYASEEFTDMVATDFVLSFGAILIVASIMYLHLNSAFLTAVGMWQIVSSLPIASLFYGGVFRIPYFEFLHILVVYLVLGIGADDVFVLTDTFRHISTERPIDKGSCLSDEDLAKIMKQTLMRTGQAIFNTSFTTTVAFLSTSVSKVMPMKTCGYYAALCIVMNYIFTMTLFPAAIVIYHRRLAGKRCCCPWWASKPVGDIDPSIDVAEQQKRSCSMSGCIESFLKRAYIPFMQKKVGSRGVKVNAIFVAVVLIATAVQGAYFTSQLTPPRKPEVWIPVNHMLREFGEFFSATFFQADHDNFNEISFIWGIQDLDNTGFDQFRPYDTVGPAVFDPDFDLGSAEAQQHILDVCTAMQTIPCELDGCTGFGDNLIFETPGKAYSCFLEDMRASGNGTLPQGPAFEQEAKDFRSNANEDDFSDEVCRPDYQRNIGVIDGRLRYVAVKLRSRMFQDTPFSTGVEVRDLVQGFVDEWNAKAPVGARGMKFLAHGLQGGFAQYDLSDELLRGLFSGIAIAFPLSFLVLLGSTGNVIVSLYAVSCVGAIVVCVLGFCKSAMDWDLGIGEAIAGVIVIGYSVDYVVHLAHIYTEAAAYGHQTREARTEFAIQNMGSTIFAGAFTTAGSGAIMFACFIMFFVKMAVLICVTIMYSLLFSMGLLVALLYLVGPEGSCGDLRCRALQGKVQAADSGAATQPDEQSPQDSGPVKPDSASVGKGANEEGPMHV